MKSNIPISISQTSPISKYNLQFSYLKRKQNLPKRKNVLSCIDRNATRSFQESSQSILPNLQQSIPMTDDRVFLKSLSLSLESKRKNIDFFTAREEQTNQVVPRNFPKRKQKGKELYFFRILRKYSQESRLLEQERLKIKLFSKQNAISGGIKPHLKPKPKEVVLKQRYCLNRERKEQNFLQMPRMDPGKSLVSIKVYPIKRNI